jgi:hypothetical protein
MHSGTRVTSHPAWQHHVAPRAKLMNLVKYNPRKTFLYLGAASADTVAASGKARIHPGRRSTYHRGIAVELSDSDRDWHLHDDLVARMRGRL